MLAGFLKAVTALPFSVHKYANQMGPYLSPSNTRTSSNFRHSLQNLHVNLTLVKRGKGYAERECWQCNGSPSCFTASSDTRQWGIALPSSPHIAAIHTEDWKVHVKRAYAAFL